MACQLCPFNPNANGLQQFFMAPMHLPESAKTRPSGVRAEIPDSLHHGAKRWRKELQAV